MNNLESLTKKLHALLPELSGQNPNIGHVLYALDKAWVYQIYSSGEQRLYDEDGEFYDSQDDASIVPKNHIALDVDGTSCIYNLSLPLHKQSPELHEFLDNLLPEPPQNAQT